VRLPNLSCSVSAMLKGMKLQYLEAGSVFAARLQMNQEIVDLSNAFCGRDRHIRGMDDDRWKRDWRAASLQARSEATTITNIIIHHYYYSSFV